jgi:hypothetical protein
VGYPNEAERRRLERFRDRIAAEDLRACFALSDRARSLVFDQRGPENRLGLAVSLCALRFLGFVPEEIVSIPDSETTGSPWMQGHHSECGDEQSEPAAMTEPRRLWRLASITRLVRRRRPSAIARGR